MHYQRWRNYGDPLTLNPRRTMMVEWLRLAVAAETDGCINWPWLRDSSGYGYYWRDADEGMVRVHRYVCEAAHGTPPSSAMLAIHSCGKGHEGCANARHLRWGTVAENSSDMVKHGRSTRGVKNPQAKLNEDQVRTIRSMKGKLSQREVGAMFGINQSAVCAIQNGRRWGSVV